MRAHLNVVHSSKVLHIFASFYVRCELKWFSTANNSKMTNEFDALVNVTVVNAVFF